MTIEDKRPFGEARLCPIKIRTRVSGWAGNGVGTQRFEHLAVDADSDYALIENPSERAEVRRVIYPRPLRVFPVRLESAEPESR